MSIFRIASSFLIFLLLIIYPSQAASSGYGIQVDPGVAVENGNLERAMTSGNDAGLDWDRLPGGYTYADNVNNGPIRLTQLFKEISEQEHRIAQFVNAARVGDVAKIDKFLSEGMDINAKNKSGNTSLMEACAAGHEDVINLLLDRQADPAIKNNIKETAAIKAIRSRQYGAIDLLRTRKAIPKEGIDREIIRYADVDFLESEFRRWSEADRKSKLANMLYFACQSGKTEVVKFFLDKGADPNQGKGESLCVCSGIQGPPVEAVRLLLDKGADPNVWKKESPLMNAAEVNRADVISLLLERGANINAQEKEEGKTALALACKAGRVQAARMLLDKGANINVKGKGGWTPLHEAAGAGSVEIVELLLKRGADAKAKTDKGNTPPDIASQRGHKKVEAVLRGHRTRR